MFEGPIFRGSHETVTGGGVHSPGGTGVGVPRVALAWAIVCIVLGGCGGSPRVERIEHLRSVGLDEPFPGASMASFHRPFDRLDLAIPIAFKRQHWGLLRADQKAAQGHVDDALQGVFRAAALLPDGRTAHVVAWPVGHSKCAVAVRVGHFGDRGHERSFLGVLAKTLRGKLIRRPRFELPGRSPKD